MDEILLDEIHYDALSSKLDQLSTYLVSLSGLDTEGLISRENIKSENGEALSPYYAALCINDIIRTNEFIRGIYFALTYIDLYKGTAIKVDESGLTLPYMLLDLSDISEDKNYLSLNYEISECPSYSYNLTTTPL